MARNNKYSNACGMTTPASKHLAKNGLENHSPGAINIILSALMEDEEYFMDSLSEENKRELEDLKPKEEDYTVDGIFNNKDYQEAFGKYADRVDELKKSFTESVKEAKNTLDKASTEEVADGTYDSELNTLKNAFHKYLNYQHHQDQIDKIIKGKSRLSAQEMAQQFDVFKENVPIEYRKEVIRCIVWNTSRLLDSAIMYTMRFSNMTREEVLETVGAEEVLQRVRNNFKKTLNNSSDNIDEERLQLSKEILENDKIWAACLVMAKKQFKEIDGIKIGTVEQYIESLDEEDSDIDSDTGEVINAEEQGAEHWQVKADTVSTLKSAQAIVRTNLYDIWNSYTDKYKNMFGCPELLEVSKMHKHLFGILDSCNSSDEMIEKLIEVGNADIKQYGWHGMLVARMKSDPYLRSAIFTVYNKSLQRYKYLTNQYSRKAGKYVWFENTENPRSFAIFAENYVSRIKNPAINVEGSIFNKGGGINTSAAKFFSEMLFNMHKKSEDMLIVNADRSDMYIRAEAFDKDFGSDYSSGFSGDAAVPYLLDDMATKTKKIEEFRKRAYDFISWADISLALGMTEEEKERLAEDAARSQGKYGSVSHSNDFINFSRGVVKIAKKLQNSNYNLADIDALRKEFGGVEEYDLGRMVTVAKTNVESTIENPTETTFRFGKRSYQNHIIPNYVNKLMEEFRKVVATKDLAKIRKFIEEKYFTCEIYAEKNPYYTPSAKFEGDTFNTSNTDTDYRRLSEPYIIKHDWLKKIYYATKEDFEDPNSFVNQFCQPLFRGLGFQNKNGDEEFKEVNKSKNLFFNIVEQLNEICKTWNGNKTCTRTPLFVTGDSNSTRSMVTPFEGNEHTLYRKMVDMSFDELARMDMIRDMNADLERRGIKGVKVCEESKTDFMLLQFFNDIKYEGKPISQWFKEHREDIQEYQRLMRIDSGFLGQLNNTHKIEINELMSENIKRLIRERIGDESKQRRLQAVASMYGTMEVLIRKALENNYKEWCNELKKTGILAETTGEVGGVYFKMDELDHGERRIDKELNINRKLPWLMYLNQTFNMALQIQLFTVDPAFYGSTSDLQKRYKQIIANGSTIDPTAVDPTTAKKIWNTKNPKQKVVYIDEIFSELDNPNDAAFDDDYITALKEAEFSDEVIERYKKHNTLTDGQAYRSFDSYRKILIGLGKWEPQMETAYNVIKQVRKEGRSYLTKEEWKIVNTVSFQPLKPLSYGFEDVEYTDADGHKKIMKVPYQHKYSEYPLIPEIMPRSKKSGKLRALALSMESNEIDLACYTSCVKEGGFGSVSIKDCKTEDDFNSVFTSQECYMHNLNLLDWKLQSNVPPHNDCERARGTQWTKHGLGGLANTTGVKFYEFANRLFPGGTVKVTNNTKIATDKGFTQDHLKQIYNAVASAGFIKSAVKLCKQMANPVTASQILCEHKFNDDRSSVANLNNYSINPDTGEFNVSPAEGVETSDNAAALLSIFRKRVIKQAMRGGSFVQVSGYGFEDQLKVHTEKTADGKTNITHADCARTWAYTVKGVDGKDVQLEYLDYVDPQTGKLLGTNGLPLEDDEDTKNSKLEKEFPGITDMIAYRIPTEKFYSIINLRATRFYPPAAGGIIQVPAQYTTIAGFDFKQY